MPGHRDAEADQPGRSPWRRPLLTLGVPALVAALGGLGLTTQAANAGDNAPEVTCTLVVPADPLSAKGLATPYRLQAPCHENDTGSAAFVQATIVDPATGAVSVYDPLVIDENTRAAAAPAAPKLPAGAVVGLWFGFNGDNLRLADAGGSLAAGKCVNGDQRSIFGQFAYCNAPAFFTAANAAIAAGRLSVPALGTAADGRPCPTTRDFGLVDMDQSDNVTTTYLVLPDGTTAQNTAANRATLGRRKAHVAINGSDNALLDAHVFPALGCTPFRAPDLADAGTPATSLALNELQAAAHQAAPIALVPTSDPMTKDGDRPSTGKTDLYRAGVGQRPFDEAVDTPTAYCTNFLQVGADRIQLDRSLTVRAASPDPAAANSLFTFLAQRFAGAYDELDCPRLLKKKNPVTVTTDGKGVVVSARFATAAPPTPSPTQTFTRPPTRSPSPSRTAGSSPASTPTPTPTRSPQVEPRASDPPQRPVDTAQPVHTTQPPAPVHTTQPPAPVRTTQPPQPVRTTQHPPQTGQVPPPVTSPAGATTSQPPAGPPAIDPPAGGGGQTDPALTDLAVDAMRLKTPKSQITANPNSFLITAFGVILLAGGGIGFGAAIVRTVRRNRGRFIPDL